MTELDKSCSVIVVLLLAKFRKHSNLNVRKVLFKEYLKLVFTVAQHEVQQLVAVILITSISPF